jgi:hypothetical protein
VFFVLVAATFFTYYQKSSARAMGSSHASHSTVQSSPDELQRWGARILPTSGSDELQRWGARILPMSESDEVQRWESRFPNVAR